MCQVPSLFLILSLTLAATIASEARGDEFAPDKACSLLTRDLLMKIETPAGRNALEGSEPDEDWVGEALREAGMTVVRNVSSCSYGRVLLVLDPIARSEEARSGMQARTFPYLGYEPVPGVGDAAFFRADSAYANLYVWTGAHHFQIEISVGYMDGEDTEAVKPNTIELAKAIIPLLP